jgi:hypothetical protein
MIDQYLFDDELTPEALEAIAEYTRLYMNISKEEYARLQAISSDAEHPSVVDPSQA